MLVGLVVAQMADIQYGSKHMDPQDNLVTELKIMAEPCPT